MKFAQEVSVIDHKRFVLATVSYQIMQAPCHSQQLPWPVCTGILAEIYRHEMTIKSPKRAAKRRTVRATRTMRTERESRIGELIMLRLGGTQYSGEIAIFDKRA